MEAGVLVADPVLVVGNNKDSVRKASSSIQPSVINSSFDGLTTDDPFIQSYSGDKETVESLKCPVQFSCPGVQFEATWVDIESLKKIYLQSKASSEVQEQSRAPSKEQWL